MRILVTGATGSIGQKLIEQLRERGNYSIRLLVQKLPTSIDAVAGLECIKGNLLDPASLDFATQDVDVVIHMAGITHSHSSDLYFQINLSGTDNLIRAAEKHGVNQFVFLSSRAASYDGGGYSKSKILAEHKLTESKLNWVIIRAAEVYGINKNYGVQKIINIIKTGRLLPIIGKGDASLAPIWIEDLILGIEQTLGRQAVSRKIFIFQGPKTYTLIELVTTIEKLLKRKVIKIYIPIFFAKGLAFVLYLFRSESIFRDQIPRLLCRKTDHHYRLADLGINPKDLDDVIRYSLSP